MGEAQAAPFLRIKFAGWLAVAAPGESGQKAPSAVLSLSNRSAHTPLNDTALTRSDTVSGSGVPESNFGTSPSVRD